MRLHQVSRILMPSRPRHHQPRSRQQRPEELPHRHVEAERRLLQHRVCGAQPVAPASTAGDCRCPDACSSHPWAGPSSPTCRSHKPHCQATHRRRHSLPAHPPRRRTRPSPRHLKQLRLYCRQQLAQVRLRQQHRWPRVLQHQSQPLTRVSRLKRQVCAARLEHAEQRPRPSPRSAP